MMNQKAIAFTLRGRFAFFKKPDVNVNDIYFTYSHIHKIALFGIIGAILGYRGHRQQDKEKDTYPEFYEKLQNVRVSIVPNSPIGYFKKKSQVFNNTVGYANKGGTLNVKEQWLDNPNWDIYLLCDDEELHAEILRHLEGKLATFIPYLGKNDHPATVERVREIEITSSDEVSQCASLAPLSHLNVKERLSKEARKQRNVNPVFLQEDMPISLSADTGHYELQTLCYTNLEVEAQAEHLSSFFIAEEKTLNFY